ncbi:MAG: hypothetical protein AAGC43_04705 [Bacteroidota bacterium]
MAEKIRIAELDIDDKGLLDAAARTKQAIDDLRQSQKDLDTSSEEGRKQFVKNQAELKNLQGEYNRQIKVIQASTTTQDKHTKALNKEVKSIDDAVANNKELRAVRNQLNSTTEEGRKAIEEINRKMDENTKLIKENSNASEKQKQNIGNYSSAVQKARVVTLAWGAALKAAGIGLIVAAVAKLSEVFGRNQKVADLLAVATNAVSKIFNDFVSFIVDNTGPVIDFFKSVFDDPRAVIQDLGNKIKANIIERFNSMIELAGLVGKAIKQVFEGDFDGAMETAGDAGKELLDVMTGVDGSFDKAQKGLGVLIGKAKEYTTEVITQAKAQADLAKSSEIALAQNAILIEQYDRQAEQLRQIRDDETKTFDERIKANEELGRVLNEQEKVMVRNADLAVANAAAQNELNNNTESYVALLDAQAEREGILAQVEGFRSEQLVNRISLLKEQQEAEEEAKQAELDREIELQERKRELQEQFQLEEEEREIAQAERELEKHLEELETLELRENEKNALLQAIQEDHNMKVAGIQAKFRNEESTKDKNLQLARVKNRQQALDKIIALVDAETGIGKAAIAAKQALALAEFAIDKGLFAGKATLKIAEAGVDSAAGQTKTAAAVPFPANIPLIAGFIAQTVGFIGSLKSAFSKGKSAQPKFALGGLLSGPSHANGGIPTPYGELEGGEAVMNKRSTALFRPLLSALNVAGGGRKFASGGILGADDAAPMSIFNPEVIKEAVAEGYASAPAPRVAVDEIAEAADRVAVVETTADL